MVLNKNPENYFAEVEQAAFGTGVLVDGLEFSDDKLLQGRTFSYSDTQRHRVGTNYLQLPINAPKTRVNTNQRDGQMTYKVDSLAHGANPHVNYEPTGRDGPHEVAPTAPAYEPMVSGKLQRSPIPRENNYQQAGERYRTFEAWERNELVKNLVELLSQTDRDVQERMVWHFSQCDPDYGRRVGEGLGIDPAFVPPVTVGVTHGA
jgi:catalase